MHAYKSALVLSLGGLGDFLTRWGLWQSIRKTFPRAAISYLGYPSHGAMLFETGLCDNVADFDRASPEKQTTNDEFDLVISILGRRGREWVRQSKLYETATVMEFDPFPQEGAGVSVSGHVMAQALSMGFIDPGPLQIDIPACARALADDVWRSHGFDGKRVVAIHPGSGATSKNWPLERFVELAARLTARGAAVIVLEGEAEEARRDRGEEPQWEPAVVRIAGLDLIGVAALLAKCERYVGNDSGMSHLAALAGAPSTVIFGPTDPTMWAPSGDVTVLRGPVPCAPCARERRDQCPDRKCLTGLSVEDVMEALT